jgi:2-polyprenyl-3-methyl-5-hydroxy-6-metoxy-1,4-benzoquinol methylase
MHEGELLMDESNFKKDNLETRQVWDANAAYWDEYMGEGNDFVEVLCWPAMKRLLNIPPESRVLDIACGNGLTSRRLSGMGFDVVAFDFSKAMIDMAIKRTSPKNGEIQYHILDATDQEALLELGEGEFHGAFCNMALFDIADIKRLFKSLSILLQPGAPFVFSVMHPCFNNPHAALVAETEDRSGEVITEYSVKVDQYLTPRVDYAVALKEQPKPQLVFHRPLQILFEHGFKAGFILDALEERAFPPDHPPGKTELSWGANFSELPPVLVARMRHIQG